MLENETCWDSLRYQTWEDTAPALCGLNMSISSFATIDKGALTCVSEQTPPSRGDDDSWGHDRDDVG